MQRHKKKWTEQDFDTMSWHDCRIYGISFNANEYYIELDIDYIFEWNLNEDRSTYDNFLVAPALLLFLDYTNLEINIPWGQTYDVIINEIKRGESVPAPNDKVNMTAYQIILENGYINLQATGYEMKLLTDPVLIDSQDLGYEYHKKLLAKDRI